MSYKEDYYKILGVGRDASQEDIKGAFRNLARQYHPDVASDKVEAEKKFKEINEAYAVLSDAEKRERYNLYGHEGLKAGAGGSGDFDFGFSGFGDLSDIFESFFDFGQPRRRTERSRASRGADVRYDVEITLDEAYKGIEKEVILNSYQKCENCNGKGYLKDSKIKTCALCQGTGQERSVQSTPFGQIVRTYNCPKCHGEGKIPDKPCKECNGDGKVFKKRKIKVKIPAGIDSDSRIRVPGHGEAGAHGGSSGDLYVFIYVKSHPIFKRKEYDLFSQVEIYFTQAALGAEVRVLTLDGVTNLKIPPGTQNETNFKIKNKGMPHIHGRGNGDLYVKVIVVVPTKLNEKQKKLLHEFAGAGPQDAEKSFFEKVKDAFTG